MKIEEMRINRYRSLYDIKLEELKDFNVLIGKNGSGKSSVLEALELFFADLNLFQPITKVFEDYFWFDRDIDSPIIFNITLSLSQGELNRIFTKELLTSLKVPDEYDFNNRNLKIIREISGSTWNNTLVSFGDWILVKENTICQEAPIWKPSTVEAPENIESSQAIPHPVSKTDISPSKSIVDIPPDIMQRVLAQFTNELKSKFRLIRTTRESGERGAPGGPRPHLLDVDSRNFITTIGQSSARKDSQRWAKCVKIFNGFSGYGMEAKAGTIHTKIGDLYLPLNLLGGGDQEVLIIERNLEEKDVVIGIEEPETHLHSEYIKKMFHLLKLHSKENQMFITTHSPIFMDRVDFDHSSVWSVKIEEKISSIQRIAVENSKDLQGILADLGVRMSDVLFAERILFVEGPTEKEIVPIVAKKMKIDLASNGLEVFPMYGKDNGNRNISMWKQLAKNTQLPMFFIFDGDAKNEVQKAIDDGLLQENEYCLLKVQDFEDLYPLETLNETLNQLLDSKPSFKKGELDPPRKKKLKDLLGEKGAKIPWWKTVLGKKVVSKMTRDEMKDSMRDIIDSLENLIRK